MHFWEVHEKGLVLLEGSPPKHKFVCTYGGLCISGGFRVYLWGVLRTFWTRNVVFCKVLKRVADSRGLNNCCGSSATKGGCGCTKEEGAVRGDGHSNGASSPGLTCFERPTSTC